MHCILKIHYVTLNGFKNNVIIYWYVIFYELFVLNFIVKMYNVFQNKLYFKNFQFGISEEMCGFQ
jgi:hypothetical protein